MAFILVAKNQNGMLVYLNETLSRSELRALREGTDFSCPDCGSKMLLKIGEVKIPHFSHTSFSSCGSSEGESAMHIEGKILLHSFFKARRIPVELEKYLPSIRQRADLFADNRAAIEFQCSPISGSDVLKRSEAYLGQNIHFTWIAGSNEASKSTIQIIRLPEYQIEMLSGPQYARHLMLLNPKNQHFYYYSNLFPLSGSRWVAKVMPLPVIKQSFPFAVPKQLDRQDFDTVSKIYAAAKLRYIQTQLFARNRYRNPFWLACYKIGLDKRNLPASIGVPVHGSECIADHPVLWQLKLMVALRRGRSIEEIIRSEDIKLRRRGTTEQLERVLLNYAAFLAEVEKENAEPQMQNGLLYDIYCKNVRKLRK